MNNLEHYRTKAGLTQSELARRTGIDQGMISRVEKNISDLSGQRWRVMAEALGCSIDDLIGMKSNSESNDRR